jgi:hypothetical protein
MPAEGIHQTALREAAAHPRLAAGARRCLVRDEDAGRLGAVLLDLAYFDRYLEEVLRYAARRPPRPSRWGDVVHAQAAVPIVLAMLRAARRARSPRLAAVGLGLASHAAIDRQLHPLINALARQHADGLTHDAAHREVEKFQSILFHEEYFGRDRMGTPGIARLVQVPMRDLFADPLVAGAVAAAYGESMAEAPGVRTLAAMGRGYEQHSAILASPLGRRLAPPREKERAQPKFLHGAWGTFAGVLKVAVDASVEVLDRAWAVFEAGDGVEATEAEAALAAVLGPGTIDPDGAGLSLAVPFTPRLA